jgi:histidinol dehydrogenase
MMTDESVPANVAIHVLDGMSKEDKQELLTRAEQDITPFLEGVKPIIEAVRRDGDGAVVRFAKQFDEADIAPAGIAASENDFDEAFSSLDTDLIKTLEYAADNIRRFHEAQRPQEMWMKEIRPGVLVGERSTPIESAALCSPRGKGSFPSVTLMTSIPAVVAGVKRPIILTPPGPDGKIDPGTLVAARIAGIGKVYKAGGAVAVAAAAFGTETIPRCLKIEGPGSPWVVAAKRLLAGEIASTVRAGPTESILLADVTADAWVAALDLLIEAEHGADSSVFLVTWVPELAREVQSLVPQLLAKMSAGRAKFASKVLGGRSGGIVLASSADQAIDFINDYAPEHLQVLSKNPFDYLSRIHNAAEILLGEHVPSSIANYVMGPNAVLPTSGAAKFGSPLGVHDFMKTTSIGHLTAAGFDELSAHAYRFAKYEGFDAHANAVSALRRRN